MCPPLLISPCTIKSRSSLLAPTHPGGPGIKGRKTVVVVVVILQTIVIAPTLSTGGGGGAEAHDKRSKK